MKTDNWNKFYLLFLQIFPQNIIYMQNILQLKPPWRFFQ